MANNYSELLKDPRWQKKRLEIFNRDEFKCVCCGSGKKTLHVHHQLYISGKKPWEYINGLLITLCDECHLSEEAWKAADDDFMNSMLGLEFTRSQINSFVVRLHDHLVNMKNRREYFDNLINSLEPTDLNGERITVFQV